MKKDDSSGSNKSDSEMASMVMSLAEKQRAETSFIDEKQLSGGLYDFNIWKN